MVAIIKAKPCVYKNNSNVSFRASDIYLIRWEICLCGGMAKKCCHVCKNNSNLSFRAADVCVIR